MTINVSHASSSNSLHEILAASFDFPGYYGKNWDAFWDCVRDPNQSNVKGDIIIKGINILTERLPIDAKLFREALQDLAKECPDVSIRWEDIIQ